MNIKNYISIVLFLIGFLPIKGIAQKKVVEYTLSCTFKGLPDKTKAYLVTQDKDTIQRALSEGDRLTFKGNLKEDGRFHFILFDTLVSNVASKAIFVCNKPITVKGTLGAGVVEVIGSPEQEEYQAFLKMSRDYSQQFNDFEKKYQNEIQTKVDEITNNAKLTKSEREVTYRKILDEKGKKLEEEIGSNYKAITRNWLLDHKHSLFVTYAMLTSLRDLQPKQIQEIFAAFSPAVKDSYYGRLLKLEIEAAAVAKGSIIPNVPMKNLQGKTVSLHELVKKNKYTLIDCWASWCSPCRAEIPKLKVIYEKYNSKGLNILGISTDKKETDWKKAVAEDKTVWKHMLEVDGNLSKSFGLKSIPAYILLDNEGKLVAFDCATSNLPNFGGSLRGENLDKKLEELLGK